MKAWSDRPPEIAALLNPAFCSFLLLNGLNAYTNNLGEDAPYVFPFVMLPLVLHKPTREIFPHSSRTTFTSWITRADTAAAKIGFAERAKNIAPYVREAMLFAMQRSTLYVTASGRLKATPVKKSFPGATQEVKDCARASIMCGKWFSTVGDFKTAMALLGVTP